MSEATTPPVSIDDIDTAPAQLPPANGLDWREAYHILNTRHREVAEANERLRIDNDDLRKKAQTREILDSLMKPYASRVFSFMFVYCLFVGFVLVADGFQWGGFHVTDSVVQVIVGSTAATVIGLVGMVLTGVFVGARKH